MMLVWKDRLRRNKAPWRIRTLMCKWFGHYMGAEQQTVVGLDMKFAYYRTCPRCGKDESTQRIPYEKHMVIRVNAEGYRRGWEDCDKGIKDTETWSIA